MTSGLRSNLISLLLASAGLWLVAALPAWLIAGTAGLEGLTYSVLLCAPPGFVAVLVAERGRDANRALAGLLVGAGLRMAAVLAVTLVLKDIRPDLGLMQYYIWLVIAYLVMLALETRLLLGKEQLARPRSRAVVSG
jgi:hypothetical protein